MFFAAALKSRRGRSKAVLVALALSLFVGVTTLIGWLSNREKQLSVPQLPVPSRWSAADLSALDASELIEYQSYDECDTVARLLAKQLMDGGAEIVEVTRSMDQGVSIYIASYGDDSVVLTCIGEGLRLSAHNSASAEAGPHAEKKPQVKVPSGFMPFNLKAGTVLENRIYNTFDDCNARARSASQSWGDLGAGVSIEEDPAAEMATYTYRDQGVVIEWACVGPMYRSEVLEAP